MRHLLSTGLVILVSAAPALAQQSTDTIPKELVTLLLRGPGSMGGEFDIRLGAPADFPKELLPDGATAAVSTVSERGVTVVAEAPALGDDTSAYRKKVEAAGWVNHGPMSMFGLMSNASQPPLMFCQGPRYATVYLSEREKGGRYARITLTSDPRRGTCRAAPSYAGPSFFADITLPRLMPPAGSRAAGSGSSSSSDHFDQHLRLQTELPMKDVVAHYVDLLKKDGWKLEGRGDAGDTSMARLQKLSDLKDPIVANLLVNKMPNGDLDVSFRLLRVDPNRRLMPAGGTIQGGIRIGGGVCCRP